MSDIDDLSTKMDMLSLTLFLLLVICLYSGSYSMSFPGGTDGKVSVYNVGDPGSIPGSGRSPGEGNGTPLQYSCLENPMDGGACSPWGCEESDTTERLLSLL